MEHRLEIAPSGRATCRTCNKPIAKGELRLGEEYASQFGADGFAIRWHHVLCAAKKVPLALQQAMQSYAGEIPDRDALDAAMAEGAKKASSGALPSADLAPTGRAKCLQCQEPIAKATVRIIVEREVDTGTFVTKGAGYLHPECVDTWAEEGWEDGLDDLVAKVKANTALAALPPPFGDATPEAIAALSEGEIKPKKGRAKASQTAANDSGPDASASAETTSEPAPAKKVKAPKTAATDAGPAFKSLSGKQVTSIVAKLTKLDQDYKADSIFDKSGLEWGDRDLLRWHIARHGLLEPTHPTLLHRLGESAWQAPADDVFAVLPKLGAPVKKEASMELIAGWTPGADLIVLRAHELDPARLEALLPDASPALRRGIQFVRGRMGAAIAAGDADDVRNAIAEVVARDWGMPSWSGVNGAGIMTPVLGPNGTRPHAFRDAQELALRFGTADQWLAALSIAARRARFGTLEHVLPALVTMPLDELITLLAKPHFSTGEPHDAQVERLVTLRDDDPIALANAALTIGRDEYPGAYLREALLIHAMGRMGARGLAIPEGLEREAKWDAFTFCVAPWRGSKVQRGAYRRALEALGRDRSLALVAPILERAWGHTQALPILSVHFDEAIARRIAAERADQGLADPDAFAALGERAIPVLTEALGTADDGSPEGQKRHAALAKCLRGVLGFVGTSGGTFDPALDAWISCSPEESYWREEAKTILLASLRALPDSRRIATLERLLTETKQLERAFLGVQTVSDAAFRARAARLVVERYGQVADKSTLQSGLQGLLPDGLEAFRAALDGKTDAKLFEQLEFVFGHAAVDAIKQAANVVAETNLARLVRLAKAFVDAHPDGVKERIYLIERADLEKGVPTRRAGSFSASRGSGPGGLARSGSTPSLDPSKTFSLDQVLAMKKQAQKADDDEEHVLTLDLEEIPALAARFPGARAVSLFAPSPEHGDAWERARLLPVPSSCTAPADGAPLSIVPLEVPSAIFEHAAAHTDPQLKELRGLVFNRPGYALGRPMFIQDDDDDGPGFVMQLAEQVGSLNLGDSGSLYVFEGAVFMQCY